MKSTAEITLHFVIVQTITDGKLCESRSSLSVISNTLNTVLMMCDGYNCLV